MPTPDPESTSPRDLLFDRWPRPLAFVFSGGGAFGPTQVGMLKALTERGIRPDLIVGCSVGSLHGAMAAADFDRSVEVMTDLWKVMDRRMLFGRRRSVAVNLFRSSTLANFNRLEALIDTHLPVTTFEELGIPFAAVATDALTGEPELLRTGPLKPALLASSAVPGVFPAVTIEDRAFVDGGVAANVPLRQAIAFGARSLVSLDATPPVVANEVPTGFVSSLIHSAALMLRSQRADAVDELAHRYPIAVIPSVTPPDMGTFNFALSEQLLADSYRSTKECLDRWEATATTSDDH